MIDPIDKMHASFCMEMERCLRNLLETKVLYQTCRCDPNAIKAAVSTEQELRVFPTAVEQYKKKSLKIVTHVDSRMVGRCYGTLIRAPATVNTSCENCKKETTPHNPIQVFPADERDVADKTYVLSYQCQKCKQGMLVYLVRRQEFKFRLVGRNQIPSVPLPTSFPKEQQDYFNDAEMAYQTGSHLAAICLLRVALEQHLRTETESPDACTGDELWGLYKQNLPADFPYTRAGSLGEIYHLLSEIIHDPSRLNNDAYPSFREKLAIFFKFHVMYSKTS